MRVAPELLLPEPVAQDGGRLGSGPILSRREGTSHERPRTQHVEEPGRSLDDAHQARGLAVPERYPVLSVRRDVIEDLDALAEVVELRPPPVLCGPEGQELLFFCVGKGPQHEAVHDAEERDGPADSQGEREGGQSCERRPTSQLPERVAEVARAVVQDTDPP